jgi:hypothetical protein
MQSNAMKKCAVGAMLFGGTLGAASTAQAGVTWLGSGTVGTGEFASTLSSTNVVFVNGNAVVYGFVGSYALEALPWSFANVDAPVFNAEGFFSETAGPGFSVGFSVNGTGLLNVNGQRVFEVTGTETLTINLSNGWGGNVSASVFDGNDYTNMIVGTNTVTLGAGTYLLEFYSEWYQAGPYSGNFISVVPAPGAMALLGAAGLIARRRKA